MNLFVQEILTGGFSLELVYSFTVSNFLIYFTFRTIVGRRLSFLVAFLKSLVPFLYISFFWNNIWSASGDDFKYINDAVGYMFFDGYINYIFSYWNIISMVILGANYSSLLFSNVILSSFGAVILCKLSMRIGFCDNYSKMLALFFALHWDVLSWTSFVNLKETVSLFLVIFLFYIIFEFNEKKTCWSFLGGCLFSFFLFKIRFYMVALFLVVYFLFVYFEMRKVIFRDFILRCFFLCAIGLFAFVVRHVAINEWELIKDNFLIISWNWPIAALIWLLQPRPWALSPEYTFLSVSSWLHWLFSPFSLIGAIHLWRQKIYLRFCILFLLVSAFFFSLTGFGPRHRFQVSFIIIWMQFHALWLVYSKYFLTKK